MTRKSKQRAGKGKSPSRPSISIDNVNARADAGSGFRLANSIPPTGSIEGLYSSAEAQRLRSMRMQAHETQKRQASSYATVPEIKEPGYHDNYEAASRLLQAQARSAGNTTSKIGGRAKPTSRRVEVSKFEISDKDTDSAEYKELARRVQEADRVHKASLRRERGYRTLDENDEHTGGRISAYAPRIDFDADLPVSELRARAQFAREQRRTMTTREAVPGYLAGHGEILPGYLVNGGEVMPGYLVDEEGLATLVREQGPGFTIFAQKRMTTTREAMTVTKSKSSKREVVEVSSDEE